MKLNQNNTAAKKQFTRELEAFIDRHLKLTLGNRPMVLKEDLDRFVKGLKTCPTCERESVGECRQCAQDNAPYLKTSSTAPVTKIGKIRI